MATQDEFWIERCFRLARKGYGMVSPNPLVGAVIVNDGRRVAEGYHKQFGGAHAEVNAIQQALRKNIDLRDATLYINLEPCFHFGKTPPCVDEIIRCRFSRVVVSSIDPNPHVAGKSIRKLRRSGIECRVGVKTAEAQFLNESFFKFVSTGIPFISMKVAQTMDGYIARSDRSSRWITNAESRKHVHTLRSRYDAVLVGAGTVLADNPRLTVRSVDGRNPLRIIIDGRLRSPVESRVFDDSAPTIVYTSEAGAKKKGKMLERINVGVVVVPSVREKISLKAVVRDLGRHQIASLLVEGGEQIYGEFLNSGLVDKIYLYTARKRFGKGISAFGKVTRPFVAVQRVSRKFGTDVYEELYL